MPELPEVEAARVLVHNHCRGRLISNATAADDTKVIEGVSPKELESALKKRSIVDAHRKGKQMWLELDEGPALMFHFGMTGYLVVQGVPIVQYVNAKTRGDEWPPKYWKVIIETDCGVKLAYCDPRRFGKVRLQENPEENEPVNKLGFDPILSMPDLQTFAGMLAKERRSIKPLILDQSFSAGVGNWVADEVLYQARIHPEQKAASLEADQCEALHHQMQAVLQTAVDAGADSSKFPDTWLFHQKWGNGKKGPAPRLEGNKIEYIQVGGRTTAFVPALQKLRGQAVSGGSKKAEGAKPKKAPEKSEAAPAAPKAAVRRRAPAPKPQSAAVEEPVETPKEDITDAPTKKATKSKAAAKEKGAAADDDGDGTEGRKRRSERAAPAERKGKAKK